MKLIIDVSKEDYKECKFRKDLLSLGGEPTDLTFNMRMETLIANGTPLPKGHGRLIDENYLLSILQCEEYETCDWKDCSDCNREKSIKRHRVLGAPTIIEADKEEKGENNEQNNNKNK